MSKSISIYDGFPKTHLCCDENNRILEARVRVAALSPFGKLICDKLRWFAGTGAGVYTAAHMFSLPNLAVETFLWPVLAFAGGVIIGQMVSARILSAKKSFHFTRDEFVVKNRFWGGKTYDRRKEHRFILKDHPLAKREAWWIELFKSCASTRGLSALMRPYFKEARLLCIEYGGQRRPIMSIHGESKADLIRGRFAALDEDLDSTIAGAGIRSTNSAQQTNDNIGGLRSSF